MFCSLEKCSLSCSFARDHRHEMEEIGISLLTASSVGKYRANVQLENFLSAERSHDIFPTKWRKMVPLLSERVSFPPRSSNLGQRPASPGPQSQEIANGNRRQPFSGATGRKKTIRMPGWTAPPRETVILIERYLSKKWSHSEKRKISFPHIRAKQWRNRAVAAFFFN